MKLTLGKKLGLGFGAILTLMLFSTIVAYIKSADIRETQDLAFERSYPTLETTRRLQRDLNQTQSKGRQIILAGTEAARREAAKKLFDGTWGDIEKEVAQLDEIAPQWTLQANRDRLASMKQQLPLLHEAQENAINHSTGSERDVIKAGNEFADQATPITEAIK